jgi:hypothetical protein
VHGHRLRWASVRLHGEWPAGRRWYLPDLSVGLTPRPASESDRSKRP